LVVVIDTDALSYCGEKYKKCFVFTGGCQFVA